MFKQYIFFVSINVLFSCCQSLDSEKNHVSEINEINQHKTHPAITAALNFINSYTENCNKMKESIPLVEWVNLNNFTTKQFNKNLKKIIEDANLQNAEMGIDVDPVFNAQDYPENGFELATFIDQSNLVEVKGKNQPEYKLKMKLVLENGVWLVDGCGIVNM